jgi:hypothetical protein
VRNLPALLAAAALVTAAGCARQPGEAGGGEPAPAFASEATTSATAAPTTSTTRKALSRTQAKAHYLEVVKPYNTALERLERSFNSGQGVDELRVLAGRVVKSNTAQIRALKAAVWPAGVRAPIRELIAESEAAQRYWRQAAEAGSRQELAQAAVAAGRHDGSEAAAEIREALGLEAYDENDYP